MAKKSRILSSKFELTPKHVEIILIVTTLLMGIAVVYLYKNKIEKELTEKYQNQQSNKNYYCFMHHCGHQKHFYQ